MRMQRVVHTSKEDARNELERLSHFLKRGHRAVFQFKTLEQAAGSYRTVLSGVQQRDACAVTPLDRCPSTFLRKVCHPTQKAAYSELHRLTSSGNEWADQTGTETLIAYRCFKMDHYHLGRLSQQRDDCVRFLQSVVRDYLLR